MNSTLVKKRPWLVDASMLGLLAVVVIIFFWPVLWGRAWIPYGGGDLVSFIYPMYRYAADMLWQGQIPLWNPHQYAGAPFVADNQSGLFYPLNLLLFFLHPNFDYGAIQGLVIGHFFLAGAAAYLCLRLFWPERPLHPWAALAGGIIFAFSDLFITHVGNLNLIAVAAWLPLALLGLHRGTLATRLLARAGWLVLSGLTLGWGILAGHGQITFLTLMLLGFYLVYRTVEQRSPWPLLLMVGAGLLALAISAVALLPALELSSFTLRAHFDYERAARYALPPAGLIGLLAPDFYGRGALHFWGEWPRVEYGYAGVLPWLLAGLAVWQRPRPQLIFFAGAGLLSLLLAMGPHTALHGWLYAILPLPFQAPARFILLLNLCLAALAAVGLDSLLRGELKQPGRFWALSGGALLLATAVLLLQAYRLGQLHPEQMARMVRAALVFVGLAGAGWLLLVARVKGYLPAIGFAVLAVGLIALDLISLGRYVEVQWDDPAVGFQRELARTYLQNDPGLHRIETATAAWQPSAAQMFGLYASDGVYNPLQLSLYNVYAGAVGYRGSPAYNLLGVKYVIGDKDQPPGDTNFIVPVYNEDPQVDIYLNIRALPRVMLLYQAELVDSQDAAFAALHRPEFDPSQTVILEAGQPLAQPPGQGELQIIAYDANRVALAVKTDKPVFLHLSDIYHPHWQATVDGRSAPILRANYAFRAIYLEPGEHQVEMRYRPPSWPIGVAVSAVTWLTLIATAVILWWRRH